MDTTLIKVFLAHIRGHIAAATPPDTTNSATTLDYGTQSVTVTAVLGSHLCHRQEVPNATADHDPCRCLCTPGNRWSLCSVRSRGAPGAHNACSQCRDTTVPLVHS